MENTDGNVNPPNDDKDFLNLEKNQEEIDAELQSIEESDDLDALKDFAREKLEAEKKTSEQNKQLFARAKKGEGFELKEGKWVKKPIAPKVDPVVKQEVEVKTDESFDEKLNKALEKRELDSLDLDEDLKNDVKTYAKMNGVSVKKAMDSNYIKFRLNEVQANAKNDDASVSSTHKPTKQDYSSMSPTDFDCTTEEGAKAFEKYKEHIKNA